MAKIKPVLFIAFVLLLITSGHHVFSADEIVTDSIQNQISTQVEQIEEKSRQLPTRDEEPEIELEKEKDALVSDTGPKFYLKKIILEGNTIYPTSAFDEIIKKYEGQEVRFKDIRDLTLLITNYYRTKGYATSRAFVPPQTLEGGTVKVQIIEGRVGKVIPEGNKWIPPRYYKHALQIKEDQIFRIQDLEKGLRNINSSYDRQAKAYLIAGEKPLTSDIILKTKDRIPVHIGYEFNNHGTKLTHRARNEMFITHSNLLGYGDSLNANLSLAEQNALWGSSFGYQLPVPELGTLLMLNSSVTHTRLAGDLREFKVRGKSWSVVPALRQQLFGYKFVNLAFYGAFEIKDSKTAIDEEKISFDRMRVLNFGPILDIRDRWGRNNFSTNVHLGIPSFLGGSPNHDPDSTRENAGGKFIYYTANYSRAQKLPLQSILFLKGTAQLSDEALPSAEQFRAGGYNSVRGYPEGDSSADRGFSYSLELRVPPYFIPKHWKIPKSKKTFRESFSLIGFLDGAYVSYDSRPRPENEKIRKLLGAGYGVRFNFDRYTSLTLDLGYPLGADSTDKDRTLLHMSVRSEY